MRGNIRLQDLKDVRANAEAACREDANVREQFHDFRAINEVLGEEDLTVKLFAWLHANRPEIAQEVHDLTCPALVRATQYKLLGKYIEPDVWFERTVQHFQWNREAEAQFGPEHREYTENSFTNKATTLISLLVVTGRSSEAGPIAEKLRGELDDSGFHEAIREALSSVVPAPWPQRG